MTVVFFRMPLGPRGSPKISPFFDAEAERPFTAVKLPKRDATKMFGPGEDGRAVRGSLRDHGHGAFNFPRLFQLSRPAAIARQARGRRDRLMRIFTPQNLVALVPRGSWTLARQNSACLCDLFRGSLRKNRFRKGKSTLTSAFCPKLEAAIFGFRECRCET